MQSIGTKHSEAGQFFVPVLTTSGFTLRISLSVIQDLGFATIEGLKAVPKRGLEIGGILLGSFDAAHSATLIEDYEPVDSEHLYGPSWLLSAKDQAVFHHALDRLRDGRLHPLQPVGFYRSQTRDALSFNDQDSALIHEMFNAEMSNNNGPALCLLIKPSLAEPSVAQLGLMTEGSLRSAGVFPFHAGVLREGDFQIVEGLSPDIENPSPVIEDQPRVFEDQSPVIEKASPVITPVEPAPQPAPPPAPLPFILKPVGNHSPDTRKPEPDSNEPARFPLTAVLLALAAAILLFLVTRYRSSHAAAPVQAVQSAPAPIATPRPNNPLPVQPPVHNDAVLLNVNRQDGTATLSWNPDASTVKGADYALLGIKDGRHREQLHISKAELKTGRLVYLPRSREISFHLKLFAQSRSTTDSVHSTMESVHSGPDLPVTPAPTPRTVQRQPTPGPVTPAYRDSDTPPAAPSAVSPPPAQTEAPSIPVPTPTRAQPALPPPTSAALTPPKPTPFPEPDKTPPKPRDPEVVTTVSLELIGHSGVKEVFGHIFGSGGDKTIPPRIVRQILPGFYPALASRIHGTRQVDVKITIGPGGQVVDTELLEDHAADPVDSLVYYAARQWTFQPARNGNKPVESKVLMHFVLRRSG